MGRWRERAALFGWCLLMGFVIGTADLPLAETTLACVVVILTGLLGVWLGWRAGRRDLVEQVQEYLV